MRVCGSGVTEGLECMSFAKQKLMIVYSRSVTSNKKKIRLVRLEVLDHQVNQFLLKSKQKSSLCQALDFEDSEKK